MFITSGAAAKIQLQFLTEKIKLVCDRFWNLYITRRPHHDKYRDFLQHFSAKLQQHIQFILISLWKISLYVLAFYFKGNALARHKDHLF